MTRRSYYIVGASSSGAKSSGSLCECVADQPRKRQIVEEMPESLHESYLVPQGSFSYQRVAVICHICF